MKIHKILKTINLIVIFLLFVSVTFAQPWLYNGSKIYYNTDNVGIGTNNPSQKLEVNGNIELPATTSTVGSIYVGTNRFIHNYGTKSTFIGENAGNTGISGAGGITGVGEGALASSANGWSNTGVGYSSLNSNTSGATNTAVGWSAMALNVSGNGNTAMGSQTLQQTTANYNSGFGLASLPSNTTGSGNTAIGCKASSRNTTGTQNTASGYQTLFTNITGQYNTAAGSEALYYNTVSNNVAYGYRSLYTNSTGTGNTASGYQSLYTNATGVSNSALGYEALKSNIRNENAAFGYRALYSNTWGDGNTATGYHALYNNTTADHNTATGMEALYNNSTGTNNTAMGEDALHDNTTGTNNTAIGNFSLNKNTTASGNTALGVVALTINVTGINNTAVGYYAGPAIAQTALSNTTAIGYNAATSQSNHIEVGDASVTLFHGNSQYTWTSDARVKNNVKEDVKGLDFIMNLRPITYNFDKDKMDELVGRVDSSDYPAKYDIEKIKQSGFLAQEVELAADNAGYDFNGVVKPKGDMKYYSLGYSTFVVPIVKAVQEQQEIIEEQNKINSDLHTKINKLEQEIAEIKSLLNLSPQPKERTTSEVKLNENIILYQNNPNPFSKETKIEYLLPEDAGAASIVIYDMNGTHLKEFHLYQKGMSSITINGGELKTGTYIYSLVVNGQKIDSKRMVITE